MDSERGGEVRSVGWNLASWSSIPLKVPQDQARPVLVLPSFAHFQIYFCFTKLFLPEKCLWLRTPLTRGSPLINSLLCFGIGLWKILPSPAVIQVMPRGLCL